MLQGRLLEAVGNGGPRRMILGSGKATDRSYRTRLTNSLNRRFSSEERRISFCPLVTTQRWRLWLDRLPHLGFQLLAECSDVTRGLLAGAAHADKGCRYVRCRCFSL